MSGYPVAQSSWHTQSAIMPIFYKCLHCLHLPSLPTELISLIWDGIVAFSLLSTKKEVSGNKYTKPSPIFSLHKIYSRFIFSMKRCQDQMFSRSWEACNGVLYAFCHRTKEQVVELVSIWPGFQHLNESLRACFSWYFVSFSWKTLWSCRWLILHLLPELYLSLLREHTVALCVRPLEWAAWLRHQPNGSLFQLRQWR